MNTISHWDEVPIFDSEDAEALFWSENRPDARLMEAAVARSSAAQESVAISLRIDPRMLARIKRLARARFLNYQSMIKQWLSERMEMETGQDTTMKNQNRHRSSGFTLIELLTVIAIIGILAGMIVGMAGIAAKKRKLLRVQTELTQIRTAIETYKSKKGYYPPDNPTNDAINALFYELAGTTHDTTAKNYTTLDGQNQIAETGLWPAGVQGLANSTTEQKGGDNFTAENFLVSIKSAQYTSNNGVLLFNVPVDGVDKSPVNPWHYVSSHPTNNPSGYDLWAEFLIGKQTNIICNWSDHPIVK